MERLGWIGVGLFLLFGAIVLGAGEVEKVVLTGHTGPIWGLDFSPDGGFLVSAGGCFDKVVRLWDVGLKMEVFPFLGSIDRVMAVSFSPDGKTIASVAPMERAVRLWDVDSGACEMLDSCAGALFSVEFSPTGELLAAGSAEKGVCLWKEVADGYELLHALVEPRDQVRDVSFSQDGKHLAAACADGRVYIWAPSTGELLGVLEAHEGGARGVAFSPDGKLLATCGADYRVRLWAVGGWPLRRVLEGHRWYVNAVTFSPDGKTLASASSDGSIILWDPATGEVLSVLKGHNKAVTGVAFSPDGKILASSSADRTILLWYLSGP